MPVRAVREAVEAQQLVAVGGAEHAQGRAASGPGARGARPRAGAARASRRASPTWPQCSQRLPTGWAPPRAPWRRGRGPRRGTRRCARTHAAGSCTRAALSTRSTATSARAASAARTSSSCARVIAASRSGGSGAGPLARAREHAVLGRDDGARIPLREQHAIARASGQLGREHVHELERAPGRRAHERARLDGSRPRRRSAACSR